MFTVWALIVLAVLGFSANAACASWPPAARLVVVPETTDPLEPLNGSRFVRVPIWLWEPLTVRARAFLLIDDFVPLDVTASTEWSVDKGTVAQVTAPGRVTYQPFARFVLRAKHPPVEGGDVLTAEMPVRGEGAAAYAIAPLPPIDFLPIRSGPPIITQQVLDALRTLQNNGSNRIISTLRDTLRNRNAEVVNDGFAHVLGEGVAGQMYLPGQLVIGGATFNGSQYSIVLSAQVSADILAGTLTANDAIFGEVPSGAMRTLAHELGHLNGYFADIGDADIDGTGAANPLGSIMHDFERKMFQASFVFYRIIPNELNTARGRWLLWLGLEQMRSWFTLYYHDQSTDSPETKALKRDVRRWIDEADWADKDANGYPDFIDKELERFHIDPETLPKIRPPEPPAGPVNPAVPPENPSTPPNDPVGPPVPTPD